MPEFLSLKNVQKNRISLEWTPAANMTGADFIYNVTYSSSQGAWSVTNSTAYATLVSLVPGTNYTIRIVTVAAGNYTSLPAFISSYTRVCLAKENGIIKLIWQELTASEERLEQLKLELSNKNDPPTQAALKEELQNFNTTAERKRKFLGRNSQVRQFGEGHRPGAILPRLIRADRKPTMVERIHSKHGTVVHTDEEIAEEFQTFYQDLYISKYNLNRYLEDTELYWVERELREPLNEIITPEEIVEAIKTLTNTKAPGPDGLTGEFYKAFAETIAPILAEVYSEALETGSLPRSSRKANIILLHKAGPERIPPGNITVINNHSTSSLQISWNQPPGIVELYTIAIQGAVNQTQNSTTAQPVTFTSLLPGREYTVTITTASGPYNETSDPVTGVTYPSMPEFLSLKNVQKNRISLEWTPAANMTGADLIYNITYTSSQGVWSVTNSTAYANLVSLVPGTNYTIRIVTVAAGNYTSFPAFISSYTRPERIPLGNITVINNHSTSSLQVIWNQPPGIVELYTIAIQGAVNQTQNSTTAQPVTFTSLLPGREYTVTITTASGPYNETSDPVTGVTYPSMPEFLSLKNVQKNRISLEWTPAANMTGADFIYNITYSSSQGAWSVTNSTPYATLVSLVPGTNYTIRIVTVAAANYTSLPGIISSFTNRSQRKLTFESGALPKSPRLQEDSEPSTSSIAQMDDGTSTIDIKSLLLDLKAGIGSLNNKMDGLSSKVDLLQHRMDTHTERLNEVEQRVSNLDDSTATLAAKVSHRESQMKVTITKCEDLEGRSRRNNIRFIGVREQQMLLKILDYLLVSASGPVHWEQCRILPKTFSDHSPVTLICNPSTTKSCLLQWRFKPGSLQDQVFASELCDEISTFLDINLGTVTSPSTIWETLKNFIRGVCLAKENGIIKLIRQELTTSEERLKQLKLELSNKNDPHTQAALKEELQNFKTMAEHKLKFLGRNSQVCQCGKGQRPGAILPRLIRADRKLTMVERIHSKHDTVVHTDEEIAEEFQTFDQDLYTSKCNSGSDTLNRYLEDTELYYERSDQVGAIAGLKINHTKSIIFLLTPGSKPFTDDYNFASETSKMRYLGILMSLNYHEVFQDNYEAVAKTLQEKVNRPERIPPGNITVINNHSTSSLQISWNQPPGIVELYTIAIHGAVNQTQNSTIAQPVTFTSLLPGREYTVTITTASGPYNETSDPVTGVTYPSMPEFLSLKNVQKNRISLEWTPAANMTGADFIYNITYSSSQGAWSVTNSTAYATLVSLVPGTNYTIRIVTVAAGNYTSFPAFTSSYTNRSQRKLTFESGALPKTPRLQEDSEPSTSSIAQMDDGTSTIDIKSRLLDLKAGIGSLNNKMDGLSSKVDLLQHRMDTHTERLNEVEQHVSNLDESTATLAAKVSHLESQMKATITKCKDLEGRSRRNNIRIIGVREQQILLKMADFVEKLCTTLFSREALSHMFVVERAHRIPSSKPVPGKPSRPITARLLNYKDRDAILRLDYLLVSASGLLHCEQCRILPKTFSDHSPVTLICNPSTTKSRLLQWRFKPGSLQDQVFASELCDEISTFLDINLGTVTSPSTIWETLKCFIRGVCLTKQNGIIKLIRQELTTSEERLKQLKLKLSNKNDPHTQAALNEELQNFKTTAERKLKFLGHNSQVRQYGKGQRPGAIPPRLIRADRNPTMVERIHSKHGTVVHPDEENAEEFQTFYQDLYTSKCNSGPERIPPGNITVINNHSTSSLQISWNQPPGIVELYTIAIQGAVNQTQNSTIAQPVTFTSLLPGREYTVTITTASGPYNETSDPVTGVTYPSMPEFPNLKNVQKNSISLEWTPAANMTGADFIYNITYTSSQGVWSVTNSTAYANLVSLIPGTNYTMRIVTVAAGNYTSLPAFISSYTRPERIPPGNITVINNHSTSSLQISWTQPPGIVELYTIAIQGAVNQTQNSTTAQPVTFTSLLPGREYTVTITTASGPYNETSDPVTGVTYPSMPEFPSLKNVQKNSISLEWTPAANMTGADFIYNITYSSSQGAWSVTNSTAYANLVSLVPGTNYTIRIVTVAAGNYTSFPAIISSYTRPELIPPGNITVINNHSTSSLQINWNQPPGIVELYTIAIQGAVKQTQNSTTAQPVTFTSLLPGREYTVTITTASGPYNETSVPVTGVTYPSMPEFPSLKNVQKNSISLEWTTPANMTGADLIYNITYTSSQGVWNVTNSTAYANLVSLVPGTNYTIRIVTVAAGNYTSLPASISSYTRPERIPPGNITVINNQSTSSLQISWNQPPGIVELYTIAIQGAVNQTQNSTTTQPVTFTSLLPGREYTVTITTASGPYNETSDPVTGVTYPSMPEFPSLKNVQKNSISLEWTPAANMTGADFIYNITYSSSQGAWSVTNSTAYANLVSLVPGTNYTIRIVTVAAGNYTSFPAIISSHTRPELIPPGNITVINNHSTSSLQINWNQPPGIVELYTIAIQGAIKQTQNSTTAQPVTFTSLLPGREYTVTITTASGPYNETSVPVTGVTYPSMPEFPSLKNVQKNSISLEWTTPANMTGADLIYNITYTSSQGVWNVTNSTAYANLVSLVPGTNYTIRIVTVAAGNYTSLPAFISSYTRPERIPPGNITVINNHSTSSLQISWNQPPGIVELYTIAIQGAVNQTQNNTTTQPVTFTSLLPGREYTVTITTASGPYNETSDPVTGVTYPSMPEFPSLKNVQKNRISLEWTPAANMTGADFIYNITYSSSQGAWSVTNSTAYATLVSLVPGTNYTIRIVTVAAANYTSLPAIISSYTRPERIPPGNITVINNHSTSSLQISWNQPPGIVELYTIAIQGAVNQTQNSTTAQPVTFTSLLPGREYTVTITTASGPYNETSDPVTGVTYPSMPEFLSLKNVQKNSISLDWTPAANMTGADFIYNVTYSSSQGAWSVTNSTAYATLVSLVPGTNYTIHIVTVAAANYTSLPGIISSYTTIRNFQAGIYIIKSKKLQDRSKGPERIPPGNITVINNHSTSSLQISWNQPPGIVELYTIAIQGAVNQTQNSTTAQPVTFTSLLPGREYTVTITTASGPYNETSDPVTGVTYPSMPEFLSLKNVQKNRISLEWTPAANMTGADFIYNITYSSSQGAWSVTNSTAYANLVSLVPGTNYTIRIVTVAAGNYTSLPGIISSYTRPERIPPGNITVINNHSTSSLQISWNQPPGIVELYTIAIQGAVNQIQNSTTAQPVTFTSLLPGREYTVAITTASGQYNETSDPVTGVTCKYICYSVQIYYPSMPEFLSLRNVQKNRISLDWTPAANMTGADFIYNITYSSSQGAWSVTNSTAYATLVRLVPGTNYTIHIVTVAAGNYISLPVIISSYTRPERIPPGNITVINNNSTSSLQISWNQPPGIVELYTIAIQGAVNQTNKSTTAQPVTFTSLLPGREYTVTITTASGPYNEISDPLTGVTNPSMPEFLSLRNVQKNRISLDWTPAANMTGVDFIYSITYSSSQGAWSVTNSTAYATLVSLVPGTNYTIHIVTVAAGNYISLPVIISSYTRPERIPPENITVINNNSTSSLQISWNQPPGIVELYTIAIQGAVNQTNKSTTAQPVTFTSLLPGREYTVTITTASGPYNEISDPVTGVTNPSMPEFLSLRNVQKNRISLDWTPAANMTGADFIYNITYSSSQGAWSVTNSTAYATLVSLVPGTNYTIHIVTVAAGNYTSLPVIISSYTRPERIPPENITVINNNSTSSLQISWNQPPGIVELYTIAIQGAVNQTKKSTTAQPVTFTSLLPGREYTVTITTASGPYNEISDPLTGVTNPSMPEFLSLRNVQKNRISLEWTPAANMTGADFIYSITYSSSQGAWSVTNSTAYATLVSLVPGTNYTIHIVTVAAGNYISLPVIISSYTRPERIPPENITVINNNSTSSLQISWNQPPGIVELYTIAIQGAVNQTKNSTTAQPVTFTSLLPGREYTVTITTASGPYNEISDPVTEVTNPSMPEFLSLRNVQKNRISLDWTPAANMTGADFIYSITYSSSQGAWSVTNSTAYATLVSLVPGTNYTIHIVTVAAGNYISLPAFISSYTRPERIPPENITVINNNSTSSLQISWNQPPGIVELYTIAIQGAVNQTKKSTTAQPVTFTSLLPGREYTVTITTASGPYNEISDPVTGVTNPSMPEFLSLRNVQKNRISLDWTPAANMTGADFIYNITYSSSQGAWSVTNSTAYATLERLVPGTNYTIHIVTVAAGNYISLPVIISSYTRPERIPPENITVINNNSTSSLQISWNQPPGIVELYTIAIQGAVNLTKKSTTAQPVTFTSLLPGREYTVTITTASGPYNEISDPVTGVTNPSMPEFLSLRNVQKNRISLDWTPAANMTGADFIYNITYSSSQGAWSVTNSTAYATLVSLVPGTNYTIHIVTVAAGNYISLPVITSSYTRPERIPPENITVINNNSTSSLQISWNQPPGIVELYTIAIHGAVNQTKKSTTTQPVTFTSLLPGREYTVTITTASGPYNETSDPVTGVTYPSMPEFLSLKNVQKNRISLEWTPAANMTGADFIYNITYSSSQGAWSVTNSTAYATLVSLVPGTNYTIHIVTVAAGNYISLPVIISSYTRPERIPLGNITVINNHSTSSLQVSWNQPPGIVELYTIAIQGAVNQTQNSTTTQPVTFTSLLPGREYTVTITTASGPYNETSDPVTGVTYPSMPEFPSLKNVQKNRISLEWTPAANMTGADFIYNITYSSSQGAWSVTNSTAYATLERLVPGTNYTIRIVTVAAGNYTSLPAFISSYTRPERIPPGNITVINNNSTSSLQISWNQPPGIVELYTIAIQGAVKQTQNSTTAQPVTFTSLLPGREYTVTITTASGPYNEISDPVTGVTNPQPPGNPGFSITSPRPGELLVKFSDFPDTNGPIVAYAVLVTLRSPAPLSLKDYLGKTYDDSKKNLTTTYVSTIKEIVQTRKRSTRSTGQEIVVGDGSTSRGYLNGPLDPLTPVTVSVGGFTHIVFTSPSGVINGIVSFVSFSSFNSTVLPSNTTTVSTVLPSNTNTVSPVDNTGAIVGGILGAIAGLTVIALAILGTVLWKRRRQSDEKLDTFSGSRVSRHKKTSGITLDNFEAFVKKQRADTNLGFEEDYENLQPVGINQPKHAAELPENRVKNRYNNVLPYDVSRVKLSCGPPGSANDYMNANYIPGYNSQREFIAAQGPLPNTVADFWRMIWEQEIYVIIMLTKCVELGKVKCDHYWPKVATETKTYGDAKVTLARESVLPDWTVRDLMVHNNKSGETRQIRQFHFTAWPDHGVPVRTDVLINFRHLIRDYMKEECPVNSPTLVHCSAGVGRTGTFIAIDRLIYQMEAEKSIDIFAVVHNLRMHRTLMVQTGAQYIFLHQCVLDMIKAQKQSEEDTIYENSEAVSIYENITVHADSRRTKDK
ncbi:uncharacterized protein [Ambystoma mexicanum]|uniref:uncharacterized protein n=1 Tax=Ambystoma mexicanum TaxID=8296 RepID=UPI0037E7A746